VDDTSTPDGNHDALDDQKSPRDIPWLTRQAISSPKPGRLRRMRAGSVRGVQTWILHTLHLVAATDAVINCSSTSTSAIVAARMLTMVEEEA